MENAPLISVIIPVYNVGEFLRRCLDSLIVQTYRNLEILLIDDGSTDGSGLCCDEYAAKDSRFKVTHKENGGVSSARNLGLDLAQGEYIAFVDADDYVKPDYFETLLHSILITNTDVVFCNCIYVDEEGNHLTEEPFSIEADCLLTELETILHQFVCGKGRHYTVVWGSLIKAKLAKTFQFSKRIIGEDTLFMFEILFSRPTIFLNAYKGYYYVQRTSSVINRIGRQDLRRTTSLMPVYCEICQKLPPLPEADRNFFFRQYAQYVCTIAHISSGLNNSAERRWYRKLLKAHLPQILPLKFLLTTSWRRHLTFYAKCPKFYSLLLRTKNSVRKLAGR